MKAKVGDVVHVRGTVVALHHGGDAHVMVLTKRDGGPRKVYQYVTPDSIVKIEPKPLAVGDRVRHGMTSWRGRILAIAGEEVWVQSDNGHRFTVYVAHLQPAED